jgi:hypothetical protein
VQRLRMLGKSGVLKLSVNKRGIALRAVEPGMMGVHAGSRRWDALAARRGGLQGSILASSRRATVAAILAKCSNCLESGYTSYALTDAAKPLSGMAPSANVSASSAVAARTSSLTRIWPSRA